MASLPEPLSCKRGDLKTLVFDPNRDLSGVDEARVLIRAPGAVAPVINRVGTKVPPTPPDTTWLVTLNLLAEDWTDPTKLEVTDPDGIPHYLVEIQTTPGPLTHPDHHPRYVLMYVEPDLGP
jgi:hypothetical protein